MFNNPGTRITYCNPVNRFISDHWIVAEKWDVDSPKLLGLTTYIEIIYETGLGKG
jgi:hypothetical protein